MTPTSRTRIVQLSTLAALAILVGVNVPGLPAPSQERQRPAIAVGNVAQVRQLTELPLDVWEIVWWPQGRYVTLLAWEGPLEVFDGDTFRSVRKLAPGRRPIHFAVSPDGETVALCENGGLPESAARDCLAAGYPQQGDAGDVDAVHEGRLQCRRRSDGQRGA